MKNIFISLLFVSSLAHAGDSSINIDQIGSNNTIQVTQDGPDHSVSVTTGATSDVDNTYMVISQQGTGAKNAQVDIRSGINNTITVNQDGAGNHTAAIQNLSGSANGITINQSGNSSHSLNITGQSGTTNSGNTIDATQSGNGNKQFDLALGGTNGASVTIQQTGSTPNIGNMLIQCNPCGAYSYIRQ
jgi:hypothetical protein